MFNRIRNAIAIRRKANREYKRIMHELRKEENENTPRRPLREDEKLMLDLARLELHAERTAQIRNA